MHRSILLAATVFSFLSASPAFAGLVLNYESSGPVTMSNLQIGQEGAIQSYNGTPLLPSTDSYTMGHAMGSLDAGLKITFTFSSAEAFSQDPSLNPALGGLASYVSPLNPSTTYGSASLYQSLQPVASDHNDALSVQDSHALPLALVFITANFLDDKTATLSITNKSRFLVGFESLLARFGHVASDLVTYKVAAVPLPAALPLFGAGLAGLAVVRRRKKETV